jgi:hypothetical protein
MKEKDLESLKEKMMGVFSPYMNSNDLVMDEIELQSFPTTAIPKIESESPLQAPNDPVNLNVTINQNSRTPISLNPINIKSNNKTVNVNLKKNETVIDNILSSKLSELIKEEKNVILREKMVKLYEKNKSSIISIPMSFITKTPYSFTTNVGNYYIETPSIKEKQDKRSFQNSASKVKLKELEMRKSQEVDYQLPKMQVQKSQEVDYQVPKISDDEFNSFDEKEKMILKQLFNATYNLQQIKNFNDEQLDSKSYEFTKNETYVAVDLNKEKKEKLNFKSLKNRLISKQKAKLLKDKKDNTKTIIPAFSTGAIISSPTFALVGENRPEMITPIEINVEKYWNLPSGRINTEMAANGTSLNSIQPNYENKVSDAISNNYKMKEETTASSTLQTMYDESEDPKNQNTERNKNHRSANPNVGRPQTNMYDFKDQKQVTSSTSILNFLMGINTIPVHRQFHM